jgi:hypothetical protein
MAGTAGGRAMTTPEDGLYVTIRNAKGEPICIVERAVAAKLGWPTGQTAPPEKTPHSATEAPQSASGPTGPRKPR